MKSRLLSLATPLAFLCLTGQSQAATLGFDIILDFTGSATAPTAAQTAAFTAAEATWESLILGYEVDDINNTVITIEVDLAAIDGAGGTLGSASPSALKLNASNTDLTPDFLYAQGGSMVFDTADLSSISNFEGVVLHEMGHVLGIGSLWSSQAVADANPTFPVPIAGRQELYVNGSGEYTGAFGLAAYNTEFSQAGAFVPIELGGGPGTANGHWNEVDGGGSPTGIVSNISGLDLRNELMTGWSTPTGQTTFISSLTTESLRDLGYLVVAPVPEPSSSLLACLSLGFLGFRRRR